MMDKKKIKYAVALVVLTTIFTAVGQLLIKLGANNLIISFNAIITNYELLGGLAIYIVGGVVMIFALKQADLSVIYPLFSLSFIWVALISVFVLGETIVLAHALGITVIIIGVYFVGRGAKYA